MSYYFYCIFYHMFFLLIWHASLSTTDPILLQTTFHVVYSIFEVLANFCPFKTFLIFYINPKVIKWFCQFVFPTPPPSFRLHILLPELQLQWNIHHLWVFLLVTFLKYSGHFPSFFWLSLCFIFSLLRFLPNKCICTRTTCMSTTKKGNIITADFRA